MLNAMYIELHSRSAFSFLEGSSLPENLIARCAEVQMPAMALLDRDGVYGAARFHMAAKKAGIKAHVGAEVTGDFFTRRPGRPRPGGLANSRIEHSRAGEGTRPYASNGLSKINQSTEAPRLPVLISSRIGYQNLCRLITKMKLR